MLSGAVSTFGADATGWVLMNFGANGLAADPTQWENTYIAALDQIHAALPNMQIYLSRPWKRGSDAAADAKADQIDVVVAARSAFTHLGDDERIWMKGADDGATMTVDGLHYSAAGQTGAANAKKAALGF